MTSPARVRLLQHLLPKNLLSGVVYRLARSERGWIKSPLIRGFARGYRVDMADAELADLAAFASFNEFFTRALKPGARPIVGDEATVVAPADGVITEHGVLDGEHLLQAKGMRYSLAELLGEDGNAVRALHGGSYLTIYLAPHNYHRVHVPLAGALTRVRYVPGERFSVSRATAAAIERLFCRNERAICWLDTPVGPMVVVLVGALNVSSVSVVGRGEIASGTARIWREEPPLPLERGAELGRFNLGSTVVVLFGPNAVRWEQSLHVGDATLMGRALGQARVPGEPRR
ncbi:MAG TPA: archaetidylserine decarboxylase [Gammaproteobacteria bacterium]|nr:archaetidylserine decarboxylase [Gammaproteobacteria bacterium]